MLDSTMIDTPKPFEDEDARWDAVRRRDRSADGSFVYGVATTGVYCRPSCPSRTARRENVSFHATPAMAEQAGFRACLRCRPKEAGSDAQLARIITDTCRRIEAAVENGEPEPALAELAAAAGLSRFHFHRLFSSATGVTPKAFAAAHRATLARRELEAGGSVTDAIYGAGYSSSSRFYDGAEGRFGMRPSDYRAGGRNMTIHFAIGACSLGAILVAATERGVCAIEFGADPQNLAERLQDRFPKARLIGGDAAFEATVAQVVAAVEAPGKALDLPLDVQGTAFQQRVWHALRQIPPGSTASYAEVAERIGMPRAVRAVAAACAANPAAVAIPCHRVVRRDGGLAGYAWGVERKRALLAREAA